MALITVVIDISKLKTGRLPEADWAKISHNVGKLTNAKTKIVIDDSSPLSLLELRAKARRMKREHDIAMIIVDYLQLMEVMIIQIHLYLLKLFSLQPGMLHQLLHQDKQLRMVFLMVMLPHIVVARRFLKIQLATHLLSHFLNFYFGFFFNNPVKKF